MLPKRLKVQLHLHHKHFKPYRKAEKGFRVGKINNKAMEKIQLIVEIEGGTGSVFVDFDSKNTFHFKGAGTFTKDVQIEKGERALAIAGSEPSDGFVLITIKKGNDELATAKFTATVFYGILPFTVKP